MSMYTERKIKRLSVTGFVLNTVAGCFCNKIMDVLVLFFLMNYFLFYCLSDIIFEVPD